MSALTDRILAQDVEGAWTETARLGPAAAPTLLPLLGHGDPRVRALAVECLAATRSPVAARALTRALCDADLGVASSAANGLEALATPELAPELLAAFDATPDWMIRKRIALLLGRLDGWDTHQLRERLGRESHPPVREGMVAALARRGEAEARATFAALLGANEPGNGPRLLHHAEYIAQPWLLRPLLPLLDDWTPALRLVEGAPGPAYLRVCDRTVDLVAKLSGRTFTGAPKPLTHYDLAVIGEVKAFLAGLPEGSPAAL